ncbi:TPA: hypothetical protein ACPHRY_004392 [Vibrio antiquarius]|uniref:hypothetical protein n=1 Tax=Vibrio antiquarius (strain Ex25) TaxID=150340 RepID=UPI000940FD11|nr:hypothetical protein [Vibrio antiquarius]OKQ16130.1 hypothetical protein H058_19785 [Vibrio antiquarius]
MRKMLDLQYELAQNSASFTFFISFMHRKQKNNDVAALAGAAIAASVSILAGSGQFSLISSAIGVSLMVIVIVYSWDCTRNRQERLAFSVVFLLLIVISFSPILEWAIVYMRCEKESFFEHLACFGKSTNSNVNGNFLFFCWLFSLPILYVSFSAFNKIRNSYSRLTIKRITNIKVVVISVVTSSLILALYMVVSYFHVLYVPVSSVS